ncbi:MAG: hypothetical protein ACLTG4_09565 [Oscillospiraceae bacterium]
MRKRCIAGILLAALLVSLCGCTSVFDKEYLSVRCMRAVNLLTDADDTDQHAGLMRAQCRGGACGRSFVLAFGDCDGVIADDLAAACEAAHRHRHRRTASKRQLWNDRSPTAGKHHHHLQPAGERGALHLQRPDAKEHS